MKNQIGRARFARSDFNVLPADSATPARLQRLQHRFFRCKTRGIMLSRNRASTVAICTFSFSENAFAKSFGAQQRFANARNFDNVYADGNDHIGSGTG